MKVNTRQEIKTNKKGPKKSATHLTDTRAAF